MNLSLTKNTIYVTIGWQVFEDHKKTFPREDLDPLMGPDGTLDPERLDDLIADHQGDGTHDSTNYRTITTFCRYRSAQS